MNKRDFILRAFKESTAYYFADWVFSLLTVVADNGRDKYPNPIPFQIASENDVYVVYVDGEWVTITDSPNASEMPLWHVGDEIVINNQNEIIQPYDTFPFKTKVGNIVLNYYCLVYAFGDRFPFQSGKMDIGAIEKQIGKRLVDDEKGKERDPTKFYPDEVKKFQSAVQSTAGFSSINNPGATEYTMQPPPGLKEFKQQLLDKYKDHLDDPSYIALIDKALVEFDKAWIAQDPEKGFYQSDKAFEVSRKRLFTMYGLESPEISNGKKELITTSLSDGWDVEKMPIMIDSLRDGSYNRGAMTALGGEAVKFIFRIFAATRIAEQDCGSKVGEPMVLTPALSIKYIGNTIILPTGKQVKLDNTNMKDYLGKHVIMRSPGFCHTHNSSYCLTCLGDSLKESVNSLAALASDVGSDMLYVFMKKMHGTALKTQLWKYTETIS